MCPTTRVPLITSDMCALFLPAIYSASLNCASHISVLFLFVFPSLLASLSSTSDVFLSQIVSLRLSLHYLLTLNRFSLEVVQAHHQAAINSAITKVK